jgi:hypothetical protein
MADSLEYEAEQEEDEARNTLDEDPDHALTGHKWCYLARIMWTCFVAGSFLDSSDLQKRMAQAARGAGGGKISGKSRLANRKWVPHAEELALEYVAKHPEASQAKIVDEIFLRLPDVKLPGFEMMKKYIAQMQKEKRLQRRVTKPLR